MSPIQQKKKDIQGEVYRKTQVPRKSSLIVALRDKNVAVREAAADRLARKANLEELTSEEVKALKTTLNDENLGVANGAAIALMYHYMDNEKWGEIEKLKNNPKFRMNIEYNLRREMQIGDRSKGINTKIVKLLKKR